MYSNCKNVSCFSYQNICQNNYVLLCTCSTINSFVVFIKGNTATSGDTVLDSFLSEWSAIQYSCHITYSVFPNKNVISSTDTRIFMFVIIRHLVICDL